MSCSGIWWTSVPPCPKCGSRIWVRVGPNIWRCVVCGYELEGVRK